MLARVALLDRGQGPVHEEDQQEEQQRERDGDLEVPLAGLEHHRRRQRARLPLMFPPTIIEAPISETWSESQRIPQISRSAPTMRAIACRTPLHRRSIGRRVY